MSLFSGGVVLAVYVMSIWPNMIDRASVCSPGMTFGMAGLVYTLEIMLGVWTVAYNFVPGGVYTREHTGHVIAVVMITIAFAMFLRKTPLIPATKCCNYSFE